MKLGYQTNTWGGVVGHPAGVTSVKDLYYLTPGSTEQAVQDISDVGYQGIELFDGNLIAYEVRPHEFRELLERYGQKLVGVYTGANFIYSEIREEEFYKIEKVAQMAAECGAEHLVLGGGAVRANGILDSDYEALGESLNRAAELAAQYGLLPSYHPHLGTIVQSPDQLDRLMKLTTISLCPDTAHIEAGGGDSSAVIRKYVNRIHYVHFKDYGSGKFLPLGEGGQDFPEIMSILRQHGFDGWITIELDSYHDPYRGAKISRAYLREKCGL